MRDDEPLYTLDEAGAVLRKSVKSIYRLAARDATFPVVRVGGTLRVHPARLRRWIAERTQGAAR